MAFAVGANTEGKREKTGVNRAEMWNYQLFVQNECALYSPELFPNAIC